MPIVPGVLQVEMIAQMAGKCIAMSLQNVLPVLGSIKGAKFYQNVRPGDQCLIKITVVKIAKSYSLAEGYIEVAGQKMSSASILFGHISRQNVSSEEFDAVTRDWLKSQGKKI
jgi:3-hydroxymyristoyl/3-hydroxydecanoyl-(acyl carrier protein) dehydratase